MSIKIAISLLITLLLFSLSPMRPGGKADAGSGGGGIDDFDTLAYGTFLGAGDNEVSMAIAADSSGSVYVTGQTRSIDFPITDGAFDVTYNGGRTDAFVAKLSADGGELLYAAFLGGSGSEAGLGISVDSSGSAYVVGVTSSADFPVTSGAFDTSHNGARDVFVAKVNADGSGLEYATFLGGSGIDSGYGVAVDEMGAVYVAGEAGSANFPSTPGAFDPSFNGGETDAFLAKLSLNGTDLSYAGFLGGEEEDFAYAIAVDSDGAAYVVGDTYSLDFPATPGSFDTSHNGGRDSYVTKVNETGSSLAYAAFLGGSNWEQSYAIAVDGGGAAFITGSTRSEDFPTTPDAYDPTYNGNYDAMVTGLNAAGSGLLYSTFAGGSEIDGGLGIAVDLAPEDGQRVIYVTGDTESTDFPVTPDAFDTTYNGGRRDAFVLRLAPNAARSQPDDLAYSTFLGGGGDGFGQDLAAGTSGGVYVSGRTDSPDFPVTAGAYDPDHNGRSDAFVAKLVIGVPAPLAFLPDAAQGYVMEWHTFGTEYRDADGGNDIAEARLSLIRRPGDRRGLGVLYDQVENALYLRDSAGEDWLGPCAPGERVRLFNGVVQLDCKLTSVTPVGTCGLRIDWRARWVRRTNSPRELRAYLRATDRIGNDSGLLELGTWLLLPEVD